MRGNVLGPVDKTVNVLIDRSYPVIKEVYLSLNEINKVYGSIESIKDLADHVEEIENLQEAANNLNKIAGSLDKLVEVQENLDSIESVHSNLESIQAAATSAEAIKQVQDSLPTINKVLNIVDDIEIVNGHLDEIDSVASNIEAIQNAEENAAIALASKEAAEAAKNAAETHKFGAENYYKLAKMWATQTDAPVSDGLYGSKYYAEQAKKSADSVSATTQEIVAEGKKQVAAVNEASETAKGELSGLVMAGEAIIMQEADEKKQELENIAGTYYKPKMTNTLLSWSNTGGFENPPTVDLRGPQGPQGEPGAGLKITGQYATYQELLNKRPIGKLGETFHIVETNETYIWDTVSGSWVSIGELKGGKGDPGPSANEILMSPDPVDYFNEIYGMTDIPTGNLIVDVSGTDPDALAIFEEVLED